jgi:2-dehydro-3-deoxyphosphogluconate aldolase/(4S)-4-hydroxy-2-oxoglutarate aldolase
MERIEVVRLMEEQGMVPLFFHSDLTTCKEVVKAVYDGGGRLLEFTNRGAFAHEVFSDLNKYIRKELPGMAIGIGSITDAAAASLYMMCGADFVVTPSWKEDIARVCNRRKVLYAPGVGSLTEVCTAEEMGCEIVKLFPGSVYGPNFIKSVKAPQPWTKIMPTGGVAPTEENLKGWFGAGATCVGMGSKLVSKDIIRDKNFAKLTKDVAAALELIKTIRK